ncbi:unnamed protein product [Acanthosepion pharaonis]|uniref:Uncharacterized protein n=1 Tax=Acanthosepion pharaonis TaxID=158019 RepID=A0A812AL50_ACAPH|nr:unnamed protein product [Sepia pharaonis]
MILSLSLSLSLSHFSLPFFVAHTPKGCLDLFDFLSTFPLLFGDLHLSHDFFHSPAFYRLLIFSLAAFFFRGLLSVSFAFFYAFPRSSSQRRFSPPPPPPPAAAFFNLAFLSILFSSTVRLFCYSHCKRVRFSTITFLSPFLSSFFLILCDLFLLLFLFSNVSQFHSFILTFSFIFFLCNKIGQAHWSDNFLLSVFFNSPTRQFLLGTIPYRFIPIPSH